MKTIIRFFIALGLILISTGLCTFGQVAISTDDSNADPSAMLEVKSTNKGFLPPRVELTAINSANPIISPAIGLLVYNTATAGISPNNITPGYYYWNGARWISVAPPQGTNPGDMLYWNGTQWVVVPLGSPGQFLQLSQSNMPTWSGAAYSSLTTTAASSITVTTATSGGNITNDGGVTVTARGVCWGTSSNPTTANSHSTDGNGTGVFVSSLSGLTANTLYYVRAYATNSVGTTYGNEVMFSTLPPVLPTITTTSVTDIAQTTATSGGNVTVDGGASVIACGVCWSTSSNPVNTGSHTTDGSGIGTFVSSLTGLTEGTLYYVRAYATNSVGTGYGNEISFTTYKSDAITDVEGNYYNIVTIGDQIWMEENLKTIKYNDGTDIPLVTDNTAWAALTIPAYCWYNNDEATNKATYGALYNWHTVNTGMLCPTGWHVPTDAEWTALSDFLGGVSVAGGKMKETGYEHWAYPNSGATNESGFTALAGGNRLTDGVFISFSYCGIFWSSSEYDATYSWGRQLLWQNDDLGRYSRTNSYGLSVRCLNDEGNPLPTVTTTAVSNIAQTSATGGGNVTSDGGATVTARGVCWSTNQNPTVGLTTKTVDGLGTGVFTSSLTGLTPNTTYYVRAYATNSVGTVYGNEVSFTTLLNPILPTVTTNTVSNIAQTTSTSGGNVTSEGGASVIVRGVCWSTSSNPVNTGSHTTDGSGIGIFVSSLTGLTEGTLYYVRAYATNSVGTGYGNEISFTTCKSDAITDIEGNYYNIVTIGDHIWMEENLKTTKYNDGTDIPLVTDNTGWAALTTPAYCWYNNDEATNKTIYGALYNWYTVNTGMLCPTGWHLPTDAEWTALSDFLGGVSVAGGKMKETGYEHWASPNSGATNESGFTALPGGYRQSDGVFISYSYCSIFWSSSEYDATYSWGRQLLWQNDDLGRYTRNNSFGLSVRCLKDGLPTVTTDAASAINYTTATSGGNVTSDGGVSVTARGVCWSTNHDPTADLTTKTVDDSGPGTFTSSLTGLTSSTLYYVRAYATNSVGTAYGNEVSFTTSWACGDPITDSRDSKTYNTVQIGTQCWLKENLNIGTRIDGSSDQTNNSNIEKYCYSNSEANCDVYGGLYQWAEMVQYLNGATNTTSWNPIPTGNVVGICPNGWHIPSDGEWTTLFSSQGGTTVAGGKMKETGTTHWLTPNTGATNSSGFTGLPTGVRNSVGNFEKVGEYVPYFSSTEYANNNMHIFYLYCGSEGITYADHLKVLGLPVRCLKD
jgi:uncharacterized protein (TIGR02145 family)